MTHLRSFWGKTLQQEGRGWILETQTGGLKEYGWSGVMVLISVGGERNRVWALEVEKRGWSLESLQRVLTSHGKLLERRKAGFIFLRRKIFC